MYTPPRQFIRTRSLIWLNSGQRSYTFLHCPGGKNDRNRHQSNLNISLLFRFGVGHDRKKKKKTYLYDVLLTSVRHVRTWYTRLCRSFITTNKHRVGDNSASRRSIHTRAGCATLSRQIKYASRRTMTWRVLFFNNCYASTVYWYRGQRIMVAKSQKFPKNFFFFILFDRPKDVWRVRSGPLVTWRSYGCNDHRWSQRVASSSLLFVVSLRDI